MGVWVRYSVGCRTVLGVVQCWVWYSGGCGTVVGVVQWPVWGLASPVEGSSGLSS